jgi:hypothetical protein
MNLVKQLGRESFFVLSLTFFEDVEDHVVLLHRFDADGIHAMFTAQITSIQPIAFDIRIGADVGAQKVPMSIAFPMFRSYTL